MGRFIGIVKVTFQEGLTYRTQFLADVSVGGVYLLSFYYLWHAIYAGRTEIAGISLASMVAYTLVSTLIGFIVRQDVNIMIGEKVYGGDIAVELTKPISYQLVVLYTAVGQALFNLFFKGVPVFILFGYQRTSFGNWGLGRIKAQDRRSPSRGDKSNRCFQQGPAETQDQLF